MKISVLTMPLMVAASVALACDIDMSVPDVNIDETLGEEWCYGDMLDLTFEKSKKLPDKDILKSEVKNDLKEMKRNNPKIIDTFERIGAKYCLPPSLLAAIASKESHIYMDPSRAMLQCTAKTKDISTCYASVSRANVEKVVHCDIEPKISKMVQRYAGHVGWSGNKMIQAALHVRHYQVEDVVGVALDEYSQDRDFSYDVILRSQHLTHLWQRLKSIDEPLAMEQCSFDIDKALHDCEKARHYQECISRKRKIDSESGQAYEASTFSDHACRKIKSAATMKQQVLRYLDSAISCLKLGEISQSQDPAVDDATLVETTLNNIHRCFLSTSPGFCHGSTFQDCQDFLRTVLNSFEGPAEHKQYILTQFNSLHHICKNRKRRSISPNWKTSYFLMDGFDDLFSDPAISPIEDIQNECSQYGYLGDCRFYECFDQRFPCDSEDSDSHQINYEAVSCVVLQENAKFFGNQKVQQFVNGYEKCMAGVLLPFYNQPSVKCTTIRSAMLNQRSNCLLQADFCDTHASNRSAVEYYLSFAASREGYPGKIPRKRITLPLSKTLIDVPVYYYQQLTFFWRAVQDVLVECRSAQGKTGSMYQKTFLKDKNGNNVLYFQALD